MTTAGISAASSIRALLRPMVAGTSSLAIRRSSTFGESYAAIDSLGDVSAALKGNAPTRLEDLYGEIDLQVRYKQTPRG